MRAAALLPLVLALAACGGESGESLQAKEKARAEELAKLQGWDRAFHPDAVIAAANQFGFRLISYSAVPGGYRAVGEPANVSTSPDGVTNQAMFTATGATKEKVDALSFELVLQHPGTAADARKRFADLVRDFLFQSRIDAKPIHDAIAAGEEGTGMIQGTPYTIATTPADANGVSRLTVTFNRTGASAPANS